MGFDESEEAGKEVDLRQSWDLVGGVWGGDVGAWDGEGGKSVSNEEKSAGCDEACARSAGFRMKLGACGDDIGTGTQE